MISSITTSIRAVHAACLVVADVAEPGLRHGGPQHDQEQQHVETPVEDPVRTATASLSWPVPPGEPGADRARCRSARRRGRPARRAAPAGRGASSAAPARGRRRRARRWRNRVIQGRRTTSAATAATATRPSSSRNDRAATAPRTLVEQAGNGGELGTEHRHGARGFACVREESAECVRACRSGRLGGLGWCGDAVGLELFGHGLADGIDQAVELLLRHAGRRRRGRLGVHCNHAGKQKADRQRNRTKGGHENSSFAAGLRPGGRRWEAPPFGADYRFILILPLHKGSGRLDMGQLARCAIQQEVRLQTLVLDCRHRRSSQD